MLLGVRRETPMIQERRSESLRGCSGRRRTGLDAHGGGQGPLGWWCWSWEDGAMTLTAPISPTKNSYQVRQESCVCVCVRVCV